MTLIQEIERIVKDNIDFVSLQQQLEAGYRNQLTVEEFQAEFPDLVAMKNYSVVFKGVNLIVLNQQRAGPFYLATIHIVNALGSPVAWYEMEFGNDHEVLDDFVGYL